MLRNLMVVATVATIGGGLAAQTGRTNLLSKAPVVGATFDMVIKHPVAEAGNGFAMLWTPHYPGTTNLGLFFVVGLLRLDPVGPFNTLYSGVFDASGTNTQPLTVPNVPGLIGGQFDAQSIDLNLGLNTIYLSDNDVTPHIVAGIGTSAGVQGSIGAIGNGDYQFQRSYNSNMGTPTAQAVAPGSFQILRHVGQKGYVEGFAGSFTSTQGNSDIHVWRRDRVARDLRSGLMQTFSLPNGFDLGVWRDQANCKKFSLLSIQRSTGAATILTGSDFTDLGVYACPSTSTAQSMYRQQIAVSDDGEIAVAVVHDSTSTVTPNVGPPDQIVLIHTDPTKLWTNGKNVLPIVTVPAMHGFYTGTIRICNETYFVEGEDPGGVTGEAVLYVGPLDGSGPATKVAVPMTGTGKPFYWSYNNWRVSQDGKTMVFPIGGEVTSSVLDMDIIAVTNISKAGPLVVKNVTNHATSNYVFSPNGANFGSVGPSNIRWSLSPDGAWLAYVGAATSAAANNVFITKTDGSTTPTLITTAAVFAATHLFYGSPEFLSNTKFAFLAGASSTFCDWYLCDITVPATPVVTKLTNSSGQNTQPYAVGGNVYNRGHFFSKNRRYLYFIRGNGASAVLKNNLVAIDSVTNNLTDITGTEFSAGVAPDLYRGPSLTALTYTVNPWPALEWSVRSIPGSDFALFVAEKAAGTSTTVFNDCNIFRFDMENAGVATQLTSNAGSGAIAAVKGITHLTISADGQWCAWAQRLQVATASEDVFVMPVTGGTPKQLSISNYVSTVAAGQSIGDGSICFTGSPVDGVCWTIGTGSIGVPLANAAIQWSRISGQGQPFLLSPVPTATPAKLYMMHSANPINQ